GSSPCRQPWLPPSSGSHGGRPSGLRRSRDATGAGRGEGLRALLVRLRDRRRLDHRSLGDGSATRDLVPGAGAPTGLVVAAAGRGVDPGREPAACQPAEEGVTVALRADWWQNACRAVIERLVCGRNLSENSIALN